MHRRTFLKAGAAVTAGGLVAPVAGALTSAASAAPRVDRVLASDLQVPWGLAFLPQGGALVGERDTSRIYRVRASGGKRLVGEVPGVRGGNPGEGGLLGLALSPAFATDRLVYAYLSTPDDDRIVRFTYAEDRLGTPEPLVIGIRTASSHHGGRLLFAPDGMLFASTGDAGEPSRARDTSVPEGKVLRMTPDGGAPPDNPFGNLVWSYGHRNVEGLALDSGGQLWATEFGSSNLDELNRIVRGGDYGWDGSAGSEGGDGAGGHRDPLVSWRNEVCSPSGVAVLGGRAWVGALRGQALWSVDLAAPGKGRKVRHFHERFGRIRTVQKAPDNSLWITTSNRDGRNPSGPNPGDDKVIRVVLR